MTHRSRLALALLPILAACGDGGADVASTLAIDTLPNGAILAQNPDAGAWDSADAWRFVEQTRIGAFEGDGPDVFAQVRDIDVDGLGRIWVLDSQLKKIQVFEPDGRHVRTIGRAGAGPGELDYAIGIEFDPRGRAWVLDAGNARYTVFDSAGRYVTSHRRESTYTPWLWEGGITDDGRVFGTSIVYGANAPDRDILIVLDSGGVTRDTIELPQFETEVYELRVDGTLVQTVVVPFTPRLVWKLADDGTLWVGTTDDYRIVNRTLEGDTLRVVEKEWTPVPVRPDDRTEWLETEWVEELRRQGADLDVSRIPATKPAWATFWVDDLGYLWVMPTPADDGGSRFDVFDPAGRYLGQVSFGDLALASLPLVRGDRAYVVTTDDMGIPYVVIGRIEGRD